MDVRCINCGKEAVILSDEKHIGGITCDGRYRYELRNIEIRCFNCGIDFTLSGNKEIINNWQKRNEVEA